MDAARWESCEHQVTARIEDAPLVAVCRYDHCQLSGGLVLAALHTHPIAILGGTVLANPFFSPPGAAGADRHDIL